ncbi:MAG: hypothetical protein GF403_05645, partial [Candidatus Coatesbacteria bacterium]|nr:hypothetical protein [Candidatus Coatesbacteria bacterium]
MTPNLTRWFALITAAVLTLLTLTGCRELPEELEITMYMTGGLSEIAARDYIITLEGDAAAWSIEEEPLSGPLRTTEGVRGREELQALYNLLVQNGIEELENAGYLGITDQFTYTVTLNDGLYNYGFKVYAPRFQADERYGVIVDAIQEFC